MLRPPSPALLPLFPIWRHHRTFEDRRPRWVWDDIRSQDWQTYREQRLQDCTRSGKKFSYYPKLVLRFATLANENALINHENTSIIWVELKNLSLLKNFLQFTKQAEKPLDEKTKSEIAARTLLGRYGKVLDDEPQQKKMSKMETSKVKATLVGLCKFVALLTLLYLFICSLTFLTDAFRLIAGRAAGKIIMWWKCSSIP